MKATQNSHPRQELLKIEKKIFQQNQRIIADSTFVADKHFKKYHARYKQAVQRYKKAVDIAEVEAAIARSRVVLAGDYHTLDQSQRSFVRVMRSYFKNRDKNVVVALETIQHRHQRHLDDFLLNKIDQKTFIKKIGFKKHWFFDLWDNYQVIFDFLKYHAIPIFGIEAPAYEKKSLRERDVYMTRHIVKLAQEYPNKKILVLVGDLHLAPPHMPREIKMQAKKEKIHLPLVMLYQNSAPIYWQLSEKDLVDHTLIVQIADKTYCRMHTPPLIVQQSYLNWLYHEEGGFDWADAKGSFLNIVEQLAHLIGSEPPRDYENVDVYTCGDLGFMKLLRRKKMFSKKDLKFIRHQIESSESYFLPRPRIAYIANVSINHAAEEASHYLKYLLTGPEHPRTPKDAFYANVLHEAAGFFGSKLINGKRKCAYYKDFAAQKKYLENADLAAVKNVEYETSVLFLKQNRLLKAGQLLHTNKIVTLSQKLFLSLSHALGYDLGDHLYYGFMAQKIKREIIKDLYSNPYDEEGEPGEVFLKLSKTLKGVKRPPKM